MQLLLQETFSVFVCMLWLWKKAAYEKATFHQKSTFESRASLTVPLKGKLTVSTRN